MKRNIFDIDDKEFARLDNKYLKTSVGKQEILKFEFLLIIGLIPMILSSVSIIADIISSFKTGLDITMPDMSIPIYFFLGVLAYAFASFTEVSNAERKFIEKELEKESIKKIEEESKKLLAKMSEEVKDTKEKVKKEIKKAIKK